MSYDLYVLEQAVASDVKQAQMVIEEGSYADGSLPYVDYASKKWEVVRALTNRHPELSPFEFDFKEIARIQRTSIADAQQGIRHVELNYPDEGLGLQLTVYDSAVEITFPYWHKDEAAAKLIAKVSELVSDLETLGLDSVYDPQLDRLISTETDFEDVLETYEKTVRAVNPDDGTKSTTKKAWWRFWE